VYNTPHGILFVPTFVLHACVCVSVLKCRIDDRSVCVCSRKKNFNGLRPRVVPDDCAERTKGEFHLVWHHLSAVNNVFKQTEKKNNNNNGPLFSIIIIVVLRCDDRRDLTISIYLWTAGAHYHYFHVLRVYWRFFIPRTSSLYVVCALLLAAAVIASETYAGGTRTFFIFLFGEQIKRLNIYMCVWY